MALGVAQRITDAGIAPSYAQPDATDSFAWPAGASAVLVHVKNTSAAACVVTVDSEALASDGLAVEDKEVTVPITTGDRIFRVSPAFRDADGDVAIAFSEQADITAAVLYI